MDDYELLDAGGGARLERFGDHVVDRPHGGALADRRAPSRWSDADVRFDRDDGWSGPALAHAQAGWTVRLADVLMELRPTDAGQVGLFPEHAQRLGWLADRVAARTHSGDGVEVLNLFAYTGLATLALARAGARLTHVDSARPSVAWARRNATLNGLQGSPIRWIVDDARAYARREARRGRRYTGIVLDPPTYGHGIGGAAPWRLEADLSDLLRTAATLLTPDGFLLLTAHAEGSGPERLAELVAAEFRVPPAVRLDALDLEMTAVSGAILRLGTCVTLDRRPA